MVAGMCDSRLLTSWKPGSKERLERKGGAHIPGILIIQSNYDCISQLTH